MCFLLLCATFCVKNEQNSKGIFHPFHAYHDQMQRGNQSPFVQSSKTIFYQVSLPSASCFISKVDRFEKKNHNHGRLFLPNNVKR